MILAALIGRFVIAALIIAGIYAAYKFVNDASKESKSNDR
jgi:hypothetical protein